jgi:prolyl-tRNA synthetase
MRYLDLRIETKRAAPARARSIGWALLVRGGYLTTESLVTPLGRLAIARLEESAQLIPDFLESLALPSYNSSGDELMFEIPGGDLQALRCAACGYSARREIAKSRRPVPAPEPTAPMRKIATPDCRTIDALAEFLGIPSHKTAKAMMYVRSADGRFVFVVIRGDTQLSERKLSDLIGELQPASPERIVAAGAVPGYASPIGLADALVVVDALVPLSANLVAGANEADFHLENTNCGRDYEAALVADLTLTRPGEPCPDCGSPLISVSAILLRDAHGFWPESILMALAQTHRDGRGLCLPSCAAPFDVSLLYLPSTQIDTRAGSENLCQVLESAGLRVLFDDRDERAGVKFNDADLIGCPVRLTVGERNLKNGMVELKRRDRDQLSLVRFEDAVEATRAASHV